MNFSYLAKIIHWLLLLISLTLIISGFGISNYQTTEKLTFGLLTKPLSFSLHSRLAIPFLALLILHTAVVLGTRWRKLKKA